MLQFSTRGQEKVPRLPITIIQSAISYNNASQAHTAESHTVGLPQRNPHKNNDPYNTSLRPSVGSLRILNDSNFPKQKEPWTLFNLEDHVNRAFSSKDMNMNR